MESFRQSGQEAIGNWLVMMVEGIYEYRSLSPPSGAPRRIAAVADEERSRSIFH